MLCRDYLFRYFDDLSYLHIGLRELFMNWLAIILKIYIIAMPWCVVKQIMAFSGLFDHL